MVWQNVAGDAVDHLAAHVAAPLDAGHDGRLALAEIVRGAFGGISPRNAAGPAANVGLVELDDSAVLPQFLALFVRWGHRPADAVHHEQG